MSVAYIRLWVSYASDTVWNRSLLPSSSIGT